LLDQRVGALEADEGNRDRSMLGHASAAEHMRADRRRKAMRDRLRGHLRARLARYFLRIARRLPPQHEAGPLRLIGTFALENVRCLGAHQDFAGVGRVLHRHQAAPRRTDRKEFEMRTAHREEMEMSRVHALRHPQRCTRVGKLDLTDIAQHVAHKHRGPTRARRVPLTFEP
jgi:hypothetical protein